MQMGNDIISVETPENLKNENGVLMTEAHMQGYLDQLAAKRRSKNTLRFYRNILYEFYDELTGEKRITQDTLLDWREKLIAENYNFNTINGRIIIINGYLEFVDAREYRLEDKLDEEVPQQGITRNEYLRLLSAARLLRRDRAYLFIKIFANTNLPSQDATKVTVEAVTAGKINVGYKGLDLEVSIPKCICEELLAHARREGIHSGPILLTRDGAPITGSNITQSMKALAPYARVPAEKCTPRSLKKMYQTMRKDMERKITMLVEQEHEQMLEQEQLTIGWEE